MLSATLLTALVLAPGQLFKDLPVADSNTVRLHVGKHGRWMLTIQGTGHTRPGGNHAATKKLLEEAGKQIAEEFANAMPLAEFTSEVKAVGENPATMVLTATGKGDDPADLLLLLRVNLALERCAFSWNRERFLISGFPPKPSETDLVGAVLGAFFTAAALDPHYKDVFVLTTDGRFVAENLPCTIEDDGRRLVLDLANYSDSAEKERTLRIEGLGD